MSLKKRAEKKLKEFKNSKVKDVTKLDNLKETNVKDVSKLDKLKEAKVKNVDVQDKELNQEGTKGPEPTILKDLPKDQKVSILEGIKKRIEVGANVIFSIRNFREKIDYIIKVIDYSGLQNELASIAKPYNPVEHSIVDFISAKGSLGESLKNLIPSPELIAFDVYHKYLELCEELGEKPTHEGTFPFIDQEYVDSLIARVRDFLLSPNTVEEGLTDSERKKQEQFISIVNQYRNPYSYPKQEGKDVEPTADVSDIENLLIKLPEGKYNKNGTPLTFASQLNRIQLIDFIKSLMGDLMNDFIHFFFIEYKLLKPQVFNRYNNGRIDPLAIVDLNFRATLTSLTNAKNLFGYTYQYFK